MAQKCVVIKRAPCRQAVKFFPADCQYKTQSPAGLKQDICDSHSLSINNKTLCRIADISRKHSKQFKHNTAWHTKMVH